MNTLKKTNSSIQPGKDKNIFLPPVLSVYVASYLSELHYEILEYYLFSKVSQIEAVYEAKIKSLEQEKINLELGIKLNRTLGKIRSLMLTIGSK